MRFIDNDMVVYRSVSALIQKLLILAKRDNGGFRYVGGFRNVMSRWKQVSIFARVLESMSIATAHILKINSSMMKLSI